MCETRGKRRTMKKRWLRMVVTVVLVGVLGIGSTVGVYAEDVVTPGEDGVLEHSAGQDEGIMLIDEFGDEETAEDGEAETVEETPARADTETWFGSGYINLIWIVIGAAVAGGVIFVRRRKNRRKEI